MRRSLNRIFLGKLGIGKFIFSGLAFVAGLALVLLALQGYIKIRDHLKPGSSKSGFIVLNKEVVMAHTLLGGRAQFTPEEIEELKRQSFVEDIGIFHSNTFEVVAHTGGNIGMYTELFFESVPSRFIENVPRNFNWQEGSDFLPVIVSQDFLDLYNFGFAIGKGTPQLSKSTIQLVPFAVEISGVQGKRSYDGKVVGFSERIPSVLVPEEFLSWANEHIGDHSDQRASRVIIKVRTGGSPALEAYVKNKGLVVSDEKMRLGKVLSAVDIFMAAALLIGIGFVVFSLVIIGLNFSLVIAQAKEEVFLLLQLGYRARQLVYHLAGYLLIFLLVACSVTAVVVGIGNWWLMGLLAEHGLAINRGFTWEAVALAVVFIVVFLALTYYSINRMIGKQIKR